VSAYDFAELESRWQTDWEAEGLYRSLVDWSRPKYYALTMLPYPSGDLHIGHWYAMTPSDTRARYMRMKGYNVLFPMGFDAFGLPAENAAVQRNIHPAKWTHSNMERMRRQLRSMGAMFDWERQAVSCEPSYYKWTEWFFKRMFEHGIAYRGEAVVNWSPTLQTVLANEQVIDGRDERTGQPVIQKLMEQWFFSITKYADELLSFDGIDWPDPIKRMQTNWIGRSEGARVRFATETGSEIEVFTTRPDTLWGATFMVLAPEHGRVDELTSPAHRMAVDEYRIAAAARSELERMEEDREKTGVFTGGYTINPVNGERIPIWIADYVLVSYGTGAIMAVPAHDHRDFAFARAFDLPVVPVIIPEGSEPLVADDMGDSYVGPGIMTDSGPLNGVETNDAKGRKNPSVSAAIDWIESHGCGVEAVNYRLRDWLISRQRYWGSPIPIVHRQDGTLEAVPDDQLPVVLPEDVVFEGRSPLVDDEAFLSVFDSDGHPARRETDTMDTFMCSSWYWFRYLSPNFDDAPFDPEEAAYWLPVDVYTGGAEHAVMHLLYSRFFVKAMRDMGVFADTEAAMRAHGRSPDDAFDEPFRVLRNQGQVLGAEHAGDVVAVEGRRDGARIIASQVTVVTGATAPQGAMVGEIMRRTENLLQVMVDGELISVEVPDDAPVMVPGIAGTNDVSQLRHHLEIERMSKSKGNVVNPDELVDAYGVDTVRTYLMFAFEWQKGGPWDGRGILGAHRFLEDVWKIAHLDYQPGETDDQATAALRRAVHQTIDKVDGDLADFKWNTAIAALMSLRNVMLDANKTPVVSAGAWAEAVEVLVKLLAPIAPHLTEELWRNRLGNADSVHVQPFPESDPTVAKNVQVTMVVQVNGKVRDRIEVPADISQEDAEATALASPRIAERVGALTVRRVIVRQPNLVNIVAN